MERKQRLALVFATVGIALGTGHLVQNRAAASAAQADAAVAPTQIVPVSAGPETVQPPVTLPADTTAALPEPVTEPSASTPVQSTAATQLADAPASAVAAEPVPSPIVTADLSPNLLPALSAPETAPMAPASIAPLVTPEAAPSAAQIAPAPTTVAPAPVVETVDACAPSLRLAAAPQAMVGVSFVAPCAPDARVVIDHEGLVITGKTNAQGTLFLSVPALAVDAKVSARLGNEPAVEQSVRVPAMATLRRMGVQWQDADAFQLHAFENGAGYDEPGHVSAAKPQIPTTGLAGTGGFITVLGDASVENPMLAEIYTFPAGIAANSDIVIESAVTEATCGRELLGETIMTLAGDVYITELTLAMPDCEAVGDILVLKNLLTDLTIAAAN